MCRCMLNVRQAVKIFIRMMVLFYCCSEINCGEKREHIRLDKCDEQFQEHHEYAECNRSNRNTETGAHRISAFCENEDQCIKRKCDDVTSSDVREKSDHQYHWFQEHSENFNRCENNENADRNA